MPTVRYLVEFPNDDRPTTLPGETRAVLAQSCAAYDLGQGGVTAEEITPDDVAALITFPRPPARRRRARPCPSPCS